MELEEKGQIVADLIAGRQELTEAVSGVTEDLAVRSPGPERWSILQCVEHVAIAEDYLFGQIGRATTATAPIPKPSREEAIRARGADRTRRVSSPAAGIRTGRFTTLAEAMRHFSETRDRTIQFVENCRTDLRSEITTHPIISTVNCYEMLLMMAAHPRRHAEQIREIRHRDGFPDVDSTS